MAKRSADVISLSMRHGRCKKGNSGAAAAAAAAAAGGDIKRERIRTAGSSSICINLEPFRKRREPRLRRVGGEFAIQPKSGIVRSLLPFINMLSRCLKHLCGSKRLIH